MLRIEHLNAGYGDLQVLWDINLEIQAGEVVALIGSNGAGKTTTLRVISGLLKPTRGYCEFDGKRIERLRPDQLVHLGIGHVPEGRQLFPELTVRENLRLGAYTRGNARSVEEDMQHTFGYFPRLRDRMAQRAGTLSGGEQQMLAIARGLMSKPRILVFDELSLGLAPMLVLSLFEVLRTLRSQGYTMLLVEQNVQMALAVSDYAYVLNHGRVETEGEARKVRNMESVHKAYLGM